MTPTIKSNLIKIALTAAFNTVAAVVFASLGVGVCAVIFTILASVGFSISLTIWLVSEVLSA